MSRDILKDSCKILSEEELAESCQMNFYKCSCPLNTSSRDKCPIFYSNELVNCKTVTPEDWFFALNED